MRNRETNGVSVMETGDPVSFSDFRALLLDLRNRAMRAANHSRKGVDRVLEMFQEGTDLIIEEVQQDAMKYSFANMEET